MLFLMFKFWNLVNCEWVIFTVFLFFQQSMMNSELYPLDEENDGLILSYVLK
ncbi:hypothetical protein Lalb_Chr18g0052111 [Lupinus albus]|uniref:Uncharacterized protein n=1 Tax=Lupinus albus TaxID=3870 RepID=A0A6A4NYP5_LUPAL|nr:hypothetical protein Lalb_Chr18g0052111 [Lupinus albus]